MGLLVEDWVSRASALQRKGRAGRVQEGICFSLFTKQRFEHQMRKFQVSHLSPCLRHHTWYMQNSTCATLPQAFQTPSWHGKLYMECVAHHQTVYISCMVWCCGPLSGTWEALLSLLAGTHCGSIDIHLVMLDKQHLPRMTSK